MKSRAQQSTIGLLCAAIILLFPIFWMVSTSFKPEGEALSASPTLLPIHATWENYRRVLLETSSFPALRWTFNSFLVSSLTTVLVLWVSSSAAYALTQLEFPGRDSIARAIVGTMMIPGQMLLIPVFVVTTSLGLFDTYGALILPGLAGGFGVFLLRQFFLSVPPELREAAMMDGASHTLIYLRIVLPTAKPALATLAIFTFIGSWNDFAWPLIVVNSLEMRTLPVGLAVFQSQYSTQYAATMAAAVIASLPISLVFLAFQKHITNGIATTGLK